MSQVTNGIRAVLSHPIAYSVFQYLMGGQSARRAFVSDNIRPQLGMKVLDIGCGPASILECLPDVEYWGFDISTAYIEAARSRYGNRGRFFCQILDPADLKQLPSFDLVLALGLIHHLNDEQALELFRLAHKALVPGGRFVTIDPCIEQGQNPLARLIIRNDRGQNVRTRDGYSVLAKADFSDSVIQVRHTAWIPYTHCVMECTR